MDGRNKQHILLPKAIHKGKLFLQTWINFHLFTTTFYLTLFNCPIRRQQWTHLWVNFECYSFYVFIFWNLEEKTVSHITILWNPQDAEVNSWLRSMEATFEARRDRVREICRKYGDPLKRKERNFAKNLMISVNHKLAYCRHGKVRANPIKLFCNHGVHPI